MLSITLLFGIPTGLGLAGCGGGASGPAATHQPAASSTPVETTPLRREGRTTSASALPYDTSTLEFTTEDGWAYTIHPELTATPTLELSKDVSESPPGKAKLVMTLTIPEYRFSIQGATPGRTAPPIELWPSRVFFRAHGTSSRDAIVNNEVCNYVPEDVDNENEYGLDCHFAIGSDFSGPGAGQETGSFEDDETTVDQLIASLGEHPDPPVISTEIRLGEGVLCEGPTLYPDGRTIGRPDCIRTG